MLEIICAKCGKNPFRTACAVEWIKIYTCHILAVLLQIHAWMTLKIYTRSQKPLHATHPLSLVISANMVTYQELVWPWRCVWWHVTVFLTCLVSNVYFKYKVQDYHKMDIGTMWHCALVSCTPSQSIGLFSGCGSVLVLSVIMSSFY